MNNHNEPANSTPGLDPLESLNNANASLSRGPISNKLTEDASLGATPNLASTSSSPSRWSNLRNNISGLFRRRRNN